MNPSDRPAFSQIFASQPGIAAAVVFGSYARGTMRPDSDIDVAIIPEKPLGAEEKAALIRQLAQHFGRPIDVVDLAVNHGPIAREALVKGELVYCRDRRAYAERVRRMLYDEADFAPILRSADRLAIRKWLKTSYAPRSAP